MPARRRSNSSVNYCCQNNFKLKFSSSSLSFELRALSSKLITDYSLIHADFILLLYVPGAPPRFKSWGGPNRAKPETRARSARDLRAKPESRAKPEKERGEGSGEGAR